MADQKIQVFAVIRVDDVAEFGVDNADIQRRVTVKQVLPTLQEAEAEVERLNSLNEDKGAYYFWQTTRFYPNGRSRVAETSVGETGG